MMISLMIRNPVLMRRQKAIAWFQASRSIARIVNDVNRTGLLTYLNRLTGELIDFALAHFSERRFGLI